MMENTETRPNLFRSFLQFSAGPWISAVISFILTPVTTWLIIPAEFGKASMFTLAYSFILQIALLGTDQSFVRVFYEKEEDKRRSLLWQCLVVPIALAVFISAAILVSRERISLILFGETGHFLPVAILSVTIITGIFDRFASLVLRMKKRGLAFSSLRIVNVSVSSVVLIAYAYFVSRTFHAVILGTLAGNLCSLAISIAMERRFWKPRLVFKEIEDIKGILRYGIPFVPTFVIVWVFQSMDRMALRHYSTFAEIGIYAAAFKLVAVLTLLQAGFTTFWTPHAYEEYERSPESTELYRKMFTMISFVMLMIAATAILFKDAVILILARSYAGAAYIMPFLIFQPLMYTVSEVTVCGINFKKRTHWHLWISVACALLNLAGNTLLVPTYGARGAAFSTGMSYVLFFFLRTWISQQCYRIPFGLKRFYALAALITVQAFINTFTGCFGLSIASSMLTIGIIVWSYWHEIKGIKLIATGVTGFLNRGKS
jgi:O-antigen/teichoic acid export membrane protein